MIIKRLKPRKNFNSLLEDNDRTIMLDADMFDVGEFMINKWYEMMPFSYATFHDYNESNGLFEVVFICRSKHVYKYSHWIMDYALTINPEEYLTDLLADLKRKIISEVVNKKEEDSNDQVNG